MTENQEQLKNLFNTFLRKPIGRNELLQTLASYLESDTYAIEEERNNLFLNDAAIEAIIKLLPETFSKTMHIHEWWEIAENIEKLCDEYPEVKPYSQQLKSLVEEFAFNEAWTSLTQLKASQTIYLESCV